MKKDVGSKIKWFFFFGVFIVILDFILSAFFDSINFFGLGFLMIFTGGYFYFFDKKVSVENSWKILKKNANYVWISLGIFLLFSLIGFIFPGFFNPQILELIRELVEMTQGMNGLELICFIFLNNLQSSLFAFLFGIFFGLVPFLTLILNGYVLGFVANKSVAIDGFSVLWKLLPHGIFEIPAVMISAGLGLKLGTYLFQFSKRDKLKKNVLELCQVFFFIVVPLLIIAAFIEGTLIWFFN
jgi:stage II sporulation protein M